MKTAVAAVLAVAALGVTLGTDVGLATETAQWFHQGFVAVYMDAAIFVTGCF